MNIVHLTASTFYGGPERQMLGLASHLRNDFHTLFVSFSEGNRAASFLQEVQKQGFRGISLVHDTPAVMKATRELTELLQDNKTDILCCHGYKAAILGRIAARRIGIRVIAVSRGWTGENRKVQIYELLDRLNLRWMDKVVCVSRGQMGRVLKSGVSPERVELIPNAVDVRRFSAPDSTIRHELETWFGEKPKWIVGSAGRLSPEKGVDVLLEAARRTVQNDRAIGFVHFGEGVMRTKLEESIRRWNMQGRFLLPGLRKDLDRFMPNFDVFALSSYTEGLPNVVLEASAAGVPVVATAVGGTPEIVVDGTTGYLVDVGDTERLRDRIQDTLSDEEQRQKMGLNGQTRVENLYGFKGQAASYETMLLSLKGTRIRERNGLSCQEAM